MTFKEQIESLRAKIKAHIKPDSSEEDVAEYSALLGEVDELEKHHASVEQENAKFKDKIIKMVMTEGDDKPPVDDSNGSNPKSIDELLAEFQAKQDNK